MSTYLLIALVVTFSAAFLVLGIRGYARRLESLDRLSSLLVPVNMDAIANLLDPAQDRYLEQRMRPADLRAVRRERALVAAGYVKQIARNASVLVRAGQLAASSSDPGLATAGKRIGAAALQTRIRALQAMGLLYLEAIIPGRPQALQVLTQYKSLDTDTYFLLGRTRVPREFLS